MPAPSKFNPTSECSVGSRRRAACRASKVDDAIAELKTVLSKESTHPQALYILGVALLERQG